MSCTTPRTIRGMSTYASVVISPATTTRPVVHSTSQATRPWGSCSSTASSTASEIWSATLSGWPSVTDSEVNRCSLIARKGISRAGPPSLLRLLPRHQGGQGIGGGDASPGDIADRGGDRQLEAAVGGQIAQRPGCRQPLHHLTDVPLDPLRADTLGQQLAGLAVPGVARGARGHQVAHAGQPAVGAGPGAEALAH